MFVDKCLKDCVENHEQCNTGSIPPLPTRVLDLGSPNETQEPRLLISNGMHGLYITLSHCWGGKVPIVTTTHNVDIHRDAMPMSSLPPTFRQAVQITRYLGIRYLWIDSLCILQDSKQDWERESMTMGEVYGRSFLTIAARAARNAQDGCFIPRRVSTVSICRLSYLAKDDPSIPLGTISILDPAFMIEDPRQSPLDTRGWVLQEKILTPRVVHYAAQQIYWECRQKATSQDGKYLVPPTSRLKQSIDVHTPFKLIFRCIKGERELVYPPDWSERRLELAVRMTQWYRLVGEYSERSLTYASDKLPALAGVARTFARLTGYKYLAGLWEEDILMGLLWWRWKRKGLPSSTWPDAPVSDLLPSWSWARFMGPLSFHASQQGYLVLLDSCCEVLNISYSDGEQTLLGAYGEVSNARITLKARLLRATATEVTRGSLDLLPKATLHDDNGKEVGSLEYDLKAHHQNPPAKELFCMVINKSVNERPLGLALMSVPGQNATFTRVGFVWFVNMPPRHYDGSDLIWKIEPSVLHLV